MKPICRYVLCTLALLVLGTALVSARGKKDVKESSVTVPAQKTVAEAPVAPEKIGDEMTFRGMVKIFGNEPHTYAGIQTEDGVKTYAVFPAESEKLIRKLQGRLVEFTVVLLYKKAGTGSLYLKDGTVQPLSWKIVD